MIEVEIESVKTNLMDGQQRVVILEEKSTGRYIPIWVGSYEAKAIVIELIGKAPGRPLPHDVLINVISDLGAEVRYVLINDLRKDVFYARVVLERDGETFEIDSRSSDAIALAVRADCGIFISEAVMDRVGQLPPEPIDLEAEISEPADASSRLIASVLGGGEAEATPEKEDTNLGAFSDFVDSLDLDELDDEK